MDDSDLARVPGQSPLDGAWSQSGGWAEVAILSDGEGDPVVGDQVVGEAAGDGAGQGVGSSVAPIQIVAGIENPLEEERETDPELSRNCRKSREKNVFLFYAIYNSIV